MKKVFRIIAVLLLAFGLTACGFKPFDRKIAKEEAEPRYYLKVACENAYVIYVSSEESSGGCSNADGDAFIKGDEIWLEAIDGFDDLRGVTVKVLGEEDVLIWSICIPITDDYAGQTEISDGEWKIFKR